MIIPSLQREFPDYRAVMTELRDSGLATTERGKKPKLSIKAPSNVSASGRAYCVRMSDGHRAK